MVDSKLVKNSGVEVVHVDLCLDGMVTMTVGLAI